MCAFSKAANIHQRGVFFTRQADFEIVFTLHCQGSMDSISAMDCAGGSLVKMSLK
jgi:hypothetical protein